MSIRMKNTICSDILRAHAAELADAEGLAPQDIFAAVDAGTMVVLANPAHKGVIPTLIGQPAKVKVNANIGTSMLVTDVAMELQKANMAKKAGAHALMDLSTAGDLTAIRRQILDAVDLPLGTVPLYAVAQHHLAKGKDPSDFTEAEIIAEIAEQAAAGVDFMTLHCGVTRLGAELAAESGRITGIVSRGGSILGRWMRRHEAENPFLTHYDDILDICLAHNVTISLGDGLRPGCGADAGDAAQWEEVINLGRLARRAKERGVQVMIEGPGHVPLHLVQSQVQGIKRLTDGAPLYVLGPLTTDCAPGYDHIAGAIGGAMAAYFGADFLCYLTPAEHLTLPGPEDVWAGIKASLVAAQSAETALGRPAAVARDLGMSKARADLDWEAMAGFALDPDLLRKRRAMHSKEKECAMCGALCAMRMMTGDSFACDADQKDTSE
ncbi:thiamine biosynthesis protein ThiC [Solidesulfovibrio fructosivorans JJ]]|uniref:Phosphomethylpyrimidine synthase n=1 Tax=Solidesulfovibrio fructosivorans JJ] TaxID=596151 RepID=E1JZA0_SOLFR|nr:phosphomethylpyrimidine synthase ThiC [Solidesulfovibrio fructosivorans]EFL50260.1 thiamine biosynthesis protein ThiC [Solidesulfovibrio fructosivorans JJ]]